MYFLGLDDTDVIGSPGTGRLARELADELSRAGIVLYGVTRHQLLVDPRVPFTSHNSSACLHIVAPEPLGPDGIWETAVRYVKAKAAHGADPAICLIGPCESPIMETLEKFGQRAQDKVLTPDAARQLAEQTGIRLATLDGRDHGLIGALAAAGLGAGGSDGRFIELGRIRTIGDTATVAAILECGVDAVQDTTGTPLPPTETVNTECWLRPDLVDHKAILIVERKNGYPWEVPALADRRRRKARA